MDDQYDDCGDPFDHYAEYSEWLMNRRAELMICNGDSLIRHIENATRYEEFIAERKDDAI